MSTVLFEENQSLRQPRLWTMIFAILAGMLVTSLRVKDSTSWIVLAIALTVSLLLYSIKLTVQVDADAVRICFFPIWKKSILLTEIVRSEARTYPPFKCVGCGFPYVFGEGWTYNVSGNQSVQLELASGERILIGSEKAEELARVIEEGKGQAWSEL